MGHSSSCYWNINHNKCFTALHIKFMCINLYNISIKEGSEESIEIINNLIFFNLKIMFIYLVCVWACIYICVGQRTKCRSHFSPTMLVLGIKLRLSSKCLYLLSHLSGTTHSYLTVT